MTGRTLAQKVRALRQAKQWSMQELADRAGVDVSYIQDIEHDRSKNPRKLAQIAKTLGTTAAELRYDVSTTNDIDHIKAWTTFLYRLAKSYEKRAGIPLGDDFHTEFIATGLEIGVSKPIPHTDAEIEKFKQQLEAVFRK